MVEILTSPNVAFNLAGGWWLVAGGWWLVAGGWGDSLCSFGPSFK
jgi:hypothetical protein